MSQKNIYYLPADATERKNAQEGTVCPFEAFRGIEPLILNGITLE